MEEQIPIRLDAGILDEIVNFYAWLEKQVEKHLTGKGKLKNQRKGKSGWEMRDEGDKLGKLLHFDLKMERLLDRLDDVKELTHIIRNGRVEKSRSVEISLDIVKFLKED